MDDDLKKLINEVLDEFFEANKNRLIPYPEIQVPPPEEKDE